MSTQNSLAAFLATTMLLAVVLVSASIDGDPPQDTVDPVMRFGMDGASIEAQKRAGVAPDYGTLWIGPWTLTTGWGGPRETLNAMRELGVTPAIHFYYWGDDISPSCVENGCWSNLHNTHKDQEGWQQLAEELIQNLHHTMDTDPVLILMETEFNKGGIENDRSFDDLLAEKTAYLKQHYPAAETVMALGNWNPDAWANFEATAAASDYVGLQGMRGSTRDTEIQYKTIFRETARGAENLQGLFDKPVIIFDIALSTYPEPEYLDHQSEVMKDFFQGLPRLKDAGVEGILYRSWYDHPTMDTDNYYKIAERHWGLAWKDGALKPGGETWVQGVQTERAGEPYPDTRPRPLDAQFNPSSSINEWWVEVHIEASHEIKRVQVKIDDDPWHTLPETDWGSWGERKSLPDGSELVFRLTDEHGRIATSDPHQW